MAHPAHLAPRPASSSNASHELPSKDLGSDAASPELGGLFHKICRNWEDYGWDTTAKKVLAYLVRSVYFRQVYRIYRIDVIQAGSKRRPHPIQGGSASVRAASTARTRQSPHPIQEGRKQSAHPAAVEPTVDRAAHNFTFKILTSENRDAIAQIESIAEWLRGHLQAAIAAGEPCLVALDGERVAGFNLISLDRASIPLVNLKRRLRPGCAWSEHIAVRKEYRRAGLGAQLRFRIFRELERTGVRRLYGGALVSNAASLSLARSVGFEEVADIHYRKFFSLEKWRYKRVHG